MTHELKLYEDFADAVLCGDKNFEVRKNDRGFQKGDLVKFRVIDRAMKIATGHPLDDETFEITYVLNGWGIEDRYVVFGIKRADAV